MRTRIAICACTAVLAGCDGGGGPEPDRRTPLAALAGVPVSAAVAVPGEADAVYLAPGFFPDLASHPLHAALHGVERVWTDRRARRHCRRPARVTGRVAERDHLTSEVFEVDGTTVAVDGRTVYAGPRRDGLPYLAGGEAITVRGRLCPRRGFLIADRVATAR